MAKIEWSSGWSEHPYPREPSDRKETVKMKRLLWWSGRPNQGWTLDSNPTVAHEKVHVQGFHVIHPVPWDLTFTAEIKGLAGGPKCPANRSPRFRFDGWDWIGDCSGPNGPMDQDGPLQIQRWPEVRRVSEIEKGCDAVELRSNGGIRCVCVRWSEQVANHNRWLRDQRLTALEDRGCARNVTAPHQFGLDSTGPSRYSVWSEFRPRPLTRSV